ncbi:MAG TPA: hypothetical protein VFK69_12355 [Candidatus Eisenbacteria bacterium]|nr:hypothetical protein [Candidatus Eisenbacteria bacterium]
MPRLTLLAIALVALAPVVAPSGARAAAPPARHPRGARRMLGVGRVTADSVWFQFAPGDFPSLRADTTGVEAPIARVRIRSVAVAMSPDGAPAALEAAGGGVWELAQPLAGAAPGDTVRFRFVVNGTWWAVPARNARNALVTHAGPQLFFVVPGREVGS